ncbi:MAG: glucose 1-dehydrogenase [Candidatus Cloacimonetes bacterium]|nr:glucose 1-dehydrogenase [Candidatus Cloacimonadota bacterium]
MNRLKDKIALITGAAKGMGAADAKLFAAEGASLILTDIDTDNLDKLAKELTDAGTKVLALRQDVSSEEDWKTLAKEVDKAFGRVDILVNNAGIVSLAGIEATDMKIWNRITGVNQTSVWLGMKYIVPLLRKAGGGSIVNIASIYGLIGSGTSAAYQAAKGAVRMLSKTAAVEFAPHKIRVNTIFPGAIATSIVPEDAGDQGAAAFDVTQLIPLRRIGESSEVAWAVLFLASDESSYITGAELVIDGGWIVP